MELIKKAHKALFGSVNRTAWTAVGTSVLVAVGVPPVMINGLVEAIISIISGSFA